MSSKSVPSLISSETLEWIKSLQAKYGFPGLAIAVVAGPGCATSAGTGTANWDSTDEWTTQIETFGVRNVRGEPYEKDTLFAIASNSKMFASLAVGILVHQGTKLPNGKPLTWQTKVKDVLGDDWVLPDEWATAHADLNDLAGMRLGMAVHMFRKMPLRPLLDPAQQLHALRHLSMDGELRQKFAYDSNCYLALSHMVPTLTGVPYHLFLQEEIFKPLGMLDTQTDSNLARASGKAADGFLRTGGGNPDGRKEDPKDILGTPRSVGWWTQDDGLWCLAAGGVALSIRDAAKLLREFLSPRHLPQQVIDERGEPLSIFPPGFPLGPGCYGRGVSVSSYRGHNILWHTGNLPGQNTVNVVVPSRRIGFYMAINDGTCGPAMLSALRCQLLDDLLGLKPTEDYEDKFMGGLIRSMTPSIPAQISDHSKSTSSTRDIGTYFHPGYYSMKLTPFDKTTAEGQAMVDIARQKAIVHAFDSDCLVVRMHKMWISHLLFRPLPSRSADVEKNKGESEETRLYEWHAFRVYDIVDQEGQAGEAGCVSTLLGKGQAVATSAGIGMFGGFATGLAMSGVKVDGDVVRDVRRVEDTAEVWFAKVM